MWRCPDEGAIEDEILQVWFPLVLCLAYGVLWFGCCHREQVIQMRSLCSGVVILDRRFRWGFCGLVLSSWTGGSDEVLLSFTNFVCSLAQFVVRSPASHRQLSLCSVIQCCLTFGFLRECNGLGDVSVVWTRPVCLGYSFPCLGLVSGDFYVFRRLQDFTDVSFLW